MAAAMPSSSGNEINNNNNTNNNNNNNNGKHDGRGGGEWGLHCYWLFGSMPALSRLLWRNAVLLTPTFLVFYLNPHIYVGKTRFEHIN